MKSLAEIEQEYYEKLNKASISQNHNEMIILFLELKVLRKFLAKKRK
jgi:hypothetical protein